MGRTYRGTCAFVLKRVSSKEEDEKEMRSLQMRSGKSSTGNQARETCQAMFTSIRGLLCSSNAQKRKKASKVESQPCVGSDNYQVHLRDRLWHG